MENVKIDPVAEQMVESLVVQGAREMLGKLVSHYRILPKMKCGLEDEIYAEAELKCIMSSEENTRSFLLFGFEGMRFRNHNRNKNGKLLSVEAYYETD